MYKQLVLFVVNLGEKKKKKNLDAKNNTWRIFEIEKKSGEIFIEHFKMWNA